MREVRPPRPLMIPQSPTRWRASWYIVFVTMVVDGRCVGSKGSRLNFTEPLKWIPPCVMVVIRERNKSGGIVPISRSSMLIVPLYFKRLRMLSSTVVLPLREFGQQQEEVAQL